MKKETHTKKIVGPTVTSAKAKTTTHKAVKAAEETSTPNFANNPSQPALATTTKKTTTRAATVTSKAISSAASTAVSSPTQSATVAVPPLIVSPAATAASSAATPSPTLALANNNTNSGGGGVSSGAIGGIVAAIIIVIAGVAAYFIIRKKKQQMFSSRTRQMSEKPDPFTMGFGSDQAFSQPQQQYQHQYGVSQPTSPTNYNSYNQQTNSFHDANNHIITSESMMPAAVAGASVTTMNTAQQYQPQLQPQQQYYNNEVQPQIIEQAAQPQPQPPLAVANIIANNNNDKLLAPTQAGSVGVFFVAATYSPTLSDEIDIQTGDQVEVLVEYDDGWCQGINLTRGNAKGVFPKHCIDYAASSAATATVTAGSTTLSNNSNSEVDRVKRTSSMYITGMPPHQ